MASGPETHELVDRSAECWRKVKSETGFDTYKEYLSNTEHYKLKDYLEKYINVNSWRTYCSVFDLSETGSLSSSFDETRLCQRRNDLEKLSTELLTVLRKPPSQASFRVLLLEASRSFGDVDPMLVSAVGLGLRIPPEFFEAYLARNQYQSEFSQKVSLKAKYGTIGKLVFMVARDYLPGRSSCPPVLLIMGSSLEGAYDLSSMQVKTAWPKSFKLLLSDYTKRYQSASLNLSMVLVHALLPLLEICLENLKESHDKAHADYLELLPNRNDNDGEATMGETRFRLRRQLRHYEKCMSDFMRYLRTQDITGLEKYEALLKINEEAKACLDDARGLESEIRDWLQLQVGDLALQESKKSIQLSNLQMEESKRGKISLLRSRHPFRLIKKMIYSQNWYGSIVTGFSVSLISGSDYSRLRLRPFKSRHLHIWNEYPAIEPEWTTHLGLHNHSSHRIVFDILRLVLHCTL